MLSFPMLPENRFEYSLTLFLDQTGLYFFVAHFGVLAFLVMQQIHYFGGQMPIKLRRDWILPFIGTWALRFRVFHFDAFLFAYAGYHFNIRVLAFEVHCSLHFVKTHYFEENWVTLLFLGVVLQILFRCFLVLLVLGLTAWTIRILPSFFPFFNPDIFQLGDFHLLLDLPRRKFWLKPVRTWYFI